MSGLYEPDAVKSLFDEMARTYGWVNVISSFGFCRLWRRQCIRAITNAGDGMKENSIPFGGDAIDLMTGMGELIPDLARQLGPHGHILAIDISTAMCNKARECKSDCDVQVVESNVLTYQFPPDHADAVACSFGLKTFSSQQIEALARIVAFTLRPGGVFSFVEISVPGSRLLRWPYMFYLNHVIPRIGRLFMGNPDNYRKLGVYTAAFQNCQKALGPFQEAGLEVRYHSYFFGCATGISGRKPKSVQLISK